jgi:O-antigen/teichoic acid export membrane protein
MAIAFVAQGVSMCLSILQAFVVPKILNVEQFGYWQLYLFYISYVGFFHLGLSSGIYLKMGGIPREKIDKASVKAQFVFGVTYQTIMALVVAALGFLLQPGPDRTFVILQTSIYMVLQNAATYLSNVLQCMNETKKSSYSTIVERISFLIPFILFIIFGIRSFRPYVFAYTFSTIVQLTYCIWNLREFITTPWLGFKTAAEQGWNSIKIGINLMLANLAGMLIMGIARFFIDLGWGIEKFGKLSLIISVINFFLAFVQQASMVLFPALRQGSKEDVKSFFVTAENILSILFPIVYILYFPLSWLLKLWLPSYADSLPYLVLLLPVCVFDSKMNILCVTIFNVIRREKAMLKINSIATLASFMLTLIGVYLLHSITFVLCGVTLVIIARSLFSETFITRLFELGKTTLSIGELLLTLVFLFAARLLPPLLALLVYSCTYAIFVCYFLPRVKATVRQLHPSKSTNDN